MQRRFRLLLSLLLVCIVIMLSACGKTTSTQAPTIRIGVALYRQDDTFISTVAQNLEQLALELEQEQNIKINLSITDSGGSQATQNEQVDRFLDLDYDVICINIVDRTAAAVIIDKAQAAEVPVIFFNREPVEEDMTRWSGAYYVGSQAVQSGLLQGHIVLDAWRENPEEIDLNGDEILQYVMLEGEPGHQDALLRTEYSVKVLSSAGVSLQKLANNTANWQRGQAAALMGEWLGEFSDQIEVVFANNDDMALGAIDACIEAGISSEELPFVVGVDATPPALQAMRDGTLQGTVLNDAEGQAQQLLSLACGLAQGENPADIADIEDEHYIWLEYSVVTPQSLDTMQ